LHTARATLSLGAMNPPIISRQPTNLTVNVDDTASFSVGVQSAAPVRYQWYFNSNVISSASNLTAATATLIISNATTTNTGSYFVIASNAFGAATSSVARLTVTVTNGAPRIDEQPTNQTAATGANASFRVTASGAPPLAYQWRFNAQPIASTANATATNAVLTLTNVTLASGGYYDVVITNSVGSTNSVLVLLTVTTNISVTTNAVVITQQPMNTVVGEGTFATFSLVATGSPAPSFQWYFSSNTISGSANPSATTSNLVLTSVQGSAAGFYWAVASNAAGAVTSTMASLTVTNATTVWPPTQTNSAGTSISNSPPFVIQAPTNQSIGAGSNASFTVAAGGANPLFYQWYLGTTVVDPSTNVTATNATFTLTNVQGLRVVHVVISNSFGTATSSNAFVSVTNSIFPGGLTAPAEFMPLRLGAVTVASGAVNIHVSGATTRRLVLEYKNLLDDPEWKPLNTNDASSLKFVDPLPLTDRSRFYRVRLE